MKPLIDELTMLWSTGVRTFDAHSQISFTMRAALMWTISDFPGYGMLSAHSTKGYWSCPQCINGTHSEYRAGRNVICCYRMWLPIDHEWRYEKEAFAGTEEFSVKPRQWSGDEILEKINEFDYGVLTNHPNFVKIYTRMRKHMPEEYSSWTHRSIFFDLPY